MKHDFYSSKMTVGGSNRFVVGVKIKYIFMTFILCGLFANASLAQQDVTTNADSLANATLATFPGGDKAFTRYLIQNIRTPSDYTVKSNTTITVAFTIEESGKLKNFVATDGPKPLQKEAIRVVKQSGRWIPAYRNGSAIASERQQRISFFVSQ